MIYELNKQDLNILNFAIDPAHRMQTVGTQMVAKLKGKLSLQRRNLIQLSLRESNLGGLMFWKSLGFIAVETIREWFENGEDAIRFEFQHPGRKPLSDLEAFDMSEKESNDFDDDDDGDDEVLA